ncbi:glycosyltransferase [Microcoleus sp. FACHB-1515]|uniref:glycosyltransferase n=1 Tax=Cyanophyceae TaxID=3028117 RepID=UPI001688BC10|nr:glycosyltransferase [Microcoleus sp. FACHB-1515]MBD2091920.1 glycosyltransferase [Microcoleus sp. FACHB-1515]
MSSIDPVPGRHDRHFCPCCGHTCDRWLDFSPTYRNVVCPHCNLQPRHRSLQLYLQTRTDFYTAKQKVLHFAPETVLRQAFAALPNLDYITADLNDPTVDIQIDITQIPFADDSFDVIFCSHVLEHVPDDGRAMRELFRVLKPGGWAFLQVPIDISREQTFEDDAIISPEDRDRFFWQFDHVRLYGLDYGDRLAAAGFQVKIEDFTAEVGAAAAEKYGLEPTEKLYFGVKPAAVEPTPTPQISVVIPTYNYGRYLTEAIESVLAQSEVAAEIIVVDDGSTDETRAVVQPYRDRIRYIRQENQGPSIARNVGLRHAQGKLILFLDADDRLLPNILAAQIDRFAADLDLNLVVNGWRLTNEQGDAIADLRLWESQLDLTLASFLKWRPVLPSATVFRRSSLENIGGFDASLRYAEDVECILRLMLNGGKADWLKKIGVCYRQHPHALTRNLDAQIRSFEQMYDRFFAQSNLPKPVQELECESRYCLLVWLAWRLQSVDRLDEMADYLQRSLLYTPFSPVETIADWMRFFSAAARTNGNSFSSYALTQTPQWQQLVRRAIAYRPPRVSVVIPSYNCAAYIVEAIESVLNQTYESVEAIVVDDGSTDNTRELLEPYAARIRYVYQENRGVASARNRAIHLARGELIALLDADDYFLLDKLVHQVAVFDAQPQVGLVNSGFRIVDSDGVARAEMKWWYITPLSIENWFLHKPVLPSAMMFRREWLVRVGGFDPRFPPAEDVDITLRVVLAGCQSAWLPEITVCYRVHDFSASSKSTPKTARSMQGVLDQVFDRLDLPESVRKLESQSRFQTYVWLAWRLYQSHHYREMQEQLEKSLRSTPFSPAETIAYWSDRFKLYAIGFGYDFEVQTLISLPEWKTATHAAIATQKLAVLMPQT